MKRKSKITIIFNKYKTIFITLLIAQIQTFRIKYSFQIGLDQLIKKHIIYANLEIFYQVF